MSSWLIIILCSLLQQTGSLVKIYAHRAGRGLAAENTIDGCKTCLELGVDYIDLDIGITKDQVLVVTHDTTLNPDITRDETGNFIETRIPVPALTFEELQRYNVGKINPQCSYAAYFPDQTPSDNAKIPSLKEAVEYIKKHACQPVGFQIEIKTDPRYTPPPKAYAEVVNNCLTEMGIIAQSEVQSLDFRFLIELKKLNPEIKTSFATGRISPKIIRSLRGSCWSVYEMAATKSSIKRAQEMGIKVIAWGYPEREGTEFNQKQILKLIEWGIDGIITDRPDKLRQTLNGNQSFPSSPIYPE